MSDKPHFKCTDDDLSLRVRYLEGVLDGLARVASKAEPVLRGSNPDEASHLAKAIEEAMRALGARKAS